MSAPQELSAAEAPDSRLLALMEAADCRRPRREGRTLSFHGSIYRALASAEVAALLETPSHRPHIRVEDIARLLNESSSG